MKHYKSRSTSATPFGFWKPFPDGTLVEVHGACGMSKRFGLVEEFNWQYTDDESCIYHARPVAEKTLEKMFVCYQGSGVVLYVGDCEESEEAAYETADRELIRRTKSKMAQYKPLKYLMCCHPNDPNSSPSWFRVPCTTDLDCEDIFEWAGYFLQVMSVLTSLPNDVDTTKIVRVAEKDIRIYKKVK